VNAAVMPRSAPLSPVTLARNISRSQASFLLIIVKKPKSAETCMSATGSYINPIIDLLSLNPAFHREN
jgi:hypothetical protein